MNKYTSLECRDAATSPFNLFQQLFRAGLPFVIAKDQDAFRFECKRIKV